MRRIPTAVALLALAGCSQIDALAPVGGDDITMVRYAGNDILVNAKIDILTAPVCEQVGELSKCEGKTMTGENITVESTGDQLVVTVGDRTLYDGSLSQVISENAQPR